MYTIEPMTIEAAQQVTEWTYHTPYDFYNLAPDEETLSELLGGHYYQVRDETENLIGFCCHGAVAQVPVGHTFGAYAQPNALDVGLGMKPEFTGKGLGFTFFQSILDEFAIQFRPTSFRLTVASFNHRAMAVYQHVGFRAESEFVRGDVTFVVMTKACQSDLNGTSV